MSKQKDIEDFLLNGNSITQRIAIEMFNAFRLSAVIFKMKAKYGKDVIEAEIIEDKENKSMFAKYKVPELKLKEYQQYGMFK